MELPEYVNVEAPAGVKAAPVVSVVIPAFNEADRLPPYLKAIQAYFQKKQEAHEIWVANDGSSDRTADVVRALMKEDDALGLVTYEKNRGKGHAVRMGMLAARGRYRLFADADGSTPIEELERLRGAIEGTENQVAVGSRAIPSPEVQRKIKPHRYVIGQVFRWFRQVLLKVNVVDSQCGFKLFTERAASAIFPVTKVDGFAFDVELLFLAARNEMPVAEVAVNWQDSDSSRVSLLTDPAKMLMDMLRIRGLHR